MCQCVCVETWGNRSVWKWIGGGDGNAFLPSLGKVNRSSLSDPGGLKHNPSGSPPYPVTVDK